MNEDLTAKQLKFAKWYLIHKARLKKLLTVFLIILNVVIWSIVIWHFIFYLRLIDSHEEMLKELTREKIDFLKMHEHFKPRDLAVSAPSVIRQLGLVPGGKEFKYDFVAQIENPNADWLIPELSFYFNSSEGKTEIQKTFILPDEKKYVFVPGREISSPPREAILEITKVSWRRLRARDKAPLEILSKICIKETDLTYIKPKEKEISLPKVSFIVENGSVYSFWEINFIIVLWRDSKLVGINTLSLSQLAGGKKRYAELIWLASVPLMTHMEVVPELNVFDERVFMPVK